uniref:Alpha-1,3/1,6-mannosyltransferase ALG2 n=1 Tax=Dendroctonus ponderosae TaxID=77166 RepID=J3JWJ7_DENPD|nr:unknown [Dendroctonus ponderosae]
MSENGLKIAFIHPDLGIGGAERLVLDVAAALKRQNHKILFVTNHFDKSHAFEELKRGEFAVEVYGDWLPRSILGKCQALCAYLRMLYLTLVFVLFFKGPDQPDLYFIDLIPIAIPILKLAKQKVIYYCHHPDLLASPPGGVLKKLYRKPIDWLELKSTALSDIILVNSNYTAEIFRKTFPQIEKPIQILYPTIAHSFQRSVQKVTRRKHIHEVVKEITSKRDDLIVFLSVNRFHPAKRLDFAVDAMEKLKSLSTDSEWEKTYCVLAGGFDPINRTNAATFEKLSQLTKSKSLEEKIIFLKSPSDSVKVDLLNSCTALLYTPLKEHFGIVPLEAMLVSKPVIAMNSGGPRETVDHGITGYLCEPTAQSMAEFMHRIIKGSVKDMGVNGRKKLDQSFTPQKFANCLRSVINEAVNFDKKRN